MTLTDAKVCDVLVGPRSNYLKAYTCQTWTNSNCFRSKARHLPLLSLILLHYLSTSDTCLDTDVYILHMHVHPYKHTHTCVCEFTDYYTCMYIHTSTHIHVCVSLLTITHACTSIQAHTYMCVWVYWLSNSIHQQQRLEAAAASATLQIHYQCITEGYTFYSAITNLVFMPTSPPPNLLLDEPLSHTNDFSFLPCVCDYKQNTMKSKWYKPVMRFLFLSSSSTSMTSSWSLFPSTAFFFFFLGLGVYILREDRRRYIS